MVAPVGGSTGNLCDKAGPLEPRGGKGQADGGCRKNKQKKTFTRLPGLRCGRRA
jgi:hypothetical protein